MKRWIVVFSVLLAVTAQANFGSSVLNKNTWVSFQHSSALDSARAYFGFPDTTNFYSDVKLTVISPDSQSVGAVTTTELDSLGSHVVRVVYFTAAGDSSYVVGQWLVDDRENSSNQYAVNFVAFDSANSLVVNAVAITVRDVAQSTVVLAAGATGTDGSFATNLDADSVVVIAVAPGYVFAAFDTLVIAGAETDTLFGYPVNSSANLVTIYGYFEDLEGNGIKWAVVDMTLPTETYNTCDSTILTTAPVKAVETDADGYFAFNLVRSSCLENTEYTITITPADGSGERTDNFTAPDSTSHKLVF